MLLGPEGERREERGGRTEDRTEEKEISMREEKRGRREERGLRTEDRTEKKGARRKER